MTATFDPTKPFEVAADEPTTAVPTFDPSKPFEPVAAASTDAPATFDPSKPFEAAPDSDLLERVRAAPIEVDSSKRFLTKDELRAVATKHGVDVEFLERMAARRRWNTESEPTFGGQLVKTAKNLPAHALGALSGVVGDWPTDLEKKFAMGDAEEKALDELDSLIWEKKSKTDVALDAVGGLAGALAGGSVIKATATALGATAGLAGAAGTVAAATSAGGQGALSMPKGEELTGFLIGIGLVGAFTGGGAAVSALRTKASKRTVEGIIKEIEESGAGEEAARRYAVDAPVDAAMKGTLFHADVEEAVAKTSPEVKDRVSQHVLSNMDAEQRAVLDELPGAAEPDAIFATYWNTARKQLDGVAKVSKDRGLSDAAKEAGGEEALLRTWELARKAQHLTDALEKTIIPADAREMGLVHRTWKFFADSRYVYDAIDRRFQTNFAPMMDRVSAAQNITTVVAVPLLKKERKLQIAATGAERELADGTSFQKNIWNMLDKGDFSGTTPKQRKVLEGLRDFYEEAAQEVEGMHLAFPQNDISPTKIARRLSGPEKSYVPHILLQPPEYVAATEKVLKEFSAEQLDRLPQLAADETEIGRRAKDILRAIEMWTGEKPTTAVDVLDAVQRMAALDRTGEALQVTANALKARDGYIPDFLIEKDVFKGASTWIRNTVRSTAMRNPLEAVRTAGEAISAKSGSWGDYVLDHVKDLSGARRNTIAGRTDLGFQKLRLKYSRMAGEETSPLKKAFYEHLSELDTTLRIGAGNMYSYYLGLRADAVVRNLGQVAFMTTPELASHLGPVDATQRTLTAYHEVFGALGKAKGGPGARISTLELEMQRVGQMPDEQAYDAIHWIEQGMKEEPYWKSKGKELLHRASAKTMWSYRTADAINRATTKSVADGIVRDAFISYERGGVPNGPLRALAGTPAGYKNEIFRALANGDVDGAKLSYSNFLLGKTQFNYNRASLSEFGRSMGWMFSMFSKWPASAIGEMGQLAGQGWRGLQKGDLSGENGSNARLMYKYIAPYLVASYVQSAFWERMAARTKDEPVSSSPASLARHTAVALLGKDLRKWTIGDTIVDSVANLRYGRTLPLADVAKAGGQSIKNLDPSSLIGMALETGTSMTPGGVYIKKLLEVAPVMVGEKPIRLGDDTTKAIRHGVVNPIRKGLGMSPAKEERR